MDVFSGEASFGQMMIGFIMHNIPVLFLTAVLIISWRYEIVGGIGYLLAGLFYVALLIYVSMKHGFQKYSIEWAVMIACPAFLIGLLFLLSWWVSRKKDAITREDLS